MLRDQRYRARLVQILLIAAVGALVLLVVQTTVANLRARGIPIGFDFLSLPSRFVISESLLRYRPQDPYTWAILVGLANSIFISVLVVVLSTVLGLVVGIGRLSSNPLVSGSCRVWVEVARNTPPIVLLFFL
ncbi:MAG: ABC transporter permease subunit [Inquilinus sp.]|uniref:ABC transporter permease subunit n=1 Tax=Inquilinus sp. TaxID=1932117 RepID=UPI003F387384